MESAELELGLGERHLVVVEEGSLVSLNQPVLSGTQACLEGPWQVPRKHL